MGYKIIDVEQNTEAWFRERLGRISGSRFGKILQLSPPRKDEIIKAIKAQGNEVDPKLTIPKLLPLLSEEGRYNLFKQGDKKIEFWRTIAERLFTTPDEDDENFGEDSRMRGHRLEPAALARFEKETGLKPEAVGIVQSEEHKDMIVSPDAVIFADKKKTLIKEAVEAKNFENAHHAEAVITKKLPSDLWPQVVQYFIVIDTLEKLHVVFHSDNTPYEKLQYFELEIKREDIQWRIDEYKQYELDTLRLMDEIVNEYAF